MPVFFATTEGQTRRIAERLAECLRDRGFDALALDLDDPEAIDWRDVRGALLGASLHYGAYQPRAHEFAVRHRAALDAVPSAFFSVSLSAASVDPAKVREAAALAHAFTEAAGWQPDLTASFAGRLAYTRYGLLKRLLLRRIAKQEGAPTDTSRDHDFTRWDAVKGLADEMADRLLAVSEPATPARQSSIPAAPGPPDAGGWSSPART